MSTKTKHTEASNNFHELSKDLTPKQVDLLMQNSSVVSYLPREIIFKQETRTNLVMFVKSGLIKIYREKKTFKSVILKFVTNNQFLGLSSFFDNEHYQYSAATLSPCEILCIDASVFRDILKENHTFTLSILSQISREAIYTFDKLLRQTHKQLPGRIADVLLYFSQEIYHSNTFPLPGTRRELAEFAGTTKESFIRTLMEFKNDKIIEISGQNVTITSIKIVQKLSNLG